MDRISLKNMRFYGYHGCYASEKETGQLFEVDVDLFVDVSNAGETDDLERTVNYVEVFQKVKEIVEQEKHNLLERVAHRIAAAILCVTGVAGVAVRVRKPGVSLGGVLDTVEVEIFRGQRT